MSALEEHLLSVRKPQMRPTSSHTSESDIRTDAGSINSGLRRTNSMIGKQIRSKLRPNDDDRPINDDADPPPQFLPQSDLESILCEEVVDEIIAMALGIADTEAIEIRKKICGNRSERRLKILATLILIEKVKYIRDFLHHEVSDEKLPLSPGFKKPLFQNWRDSHIENFCDRQFVVLAPVFDFATLKHFTFKRKFRMPFLEPLEWKSRGAHGTISRVRIHPDHLCWNTDPSPMYGKSFVAIKKFQDPIKFNQERQALKRFSLPNTGHEHLIQLLLSYQIADERFMVFPWALGNLAEFWEKNPSNPASRDDLRWFIQQCEGLARGLCKVHKHDSWHGSIEDASQADSQNRGRHGDIKPENILWFEDKKASRAHLVVADFTLMRFHSMDSVDHTEASKVGFSQTYYPPEVDAGSHTSVSQRYDIWTLGCVYLEFITWYLIGYDAIRKDYFTDSAGKRRESFTVVRSKDDKKYGVPTNRFFTNTDGSEAKVKDSVEKWIRMLHRSQHCSPAMDDFLNLVEEHMLVAVPHGRWSMDRVRARLAEILKECKHNDLYCHSDERRHIHKDDIFPPEFTKQSEQYRRVSKTTYSASTSSLDSRLKPDLNVIEEFFAGEIPTGHQPPKPTGQGNAFSSMWSNKPNGEDKSKAGQHLSPHTWYPSKRTAPSNHSFRSDSSRSLDPTDTSPGDLQLSPDADPPTPHLTPATSCRPDSSDGAFFGTADKENVVDPEDRDEVDMANAGGKHSDDSLQGCSQSLRNSSGGIGSDPRINCSDHLRAESESGKLDGRNQLASENPDDHRELSVRQRVSLLLKGRIKRARNRISRAFKRLWTKTSR